MRVLFFNPQEKDYYQKVDEKPFMLLAPREMPIDCRQLIHREHP